MAIKTWTMKRAGTILRYNIEANTLETEKAGNVTSLTPLFRRWTEPGGVLDRLAPNPGDTFDCNDVARHIYGGLNTAMQAKYANWPKDYLLREKLLNREMRLPYMLGYVGLVIKRDHRVFERTALTLADLAEPSTNTITLSRTTLEGLLARHRAMVQDLELALAN